MIDILLCTINYVIWDTFFWPSMAFTTTIGVFIGAVIYDGLLDDIRKMILSLTIYAIIITTVNLTRIVPLFDVTTIIDPSKPFASTVTLIFVTLFYLLGMYIGVQMVNKAHKFPEPLLKI